MSGWMFLSETKLEKVNKLVLFKECIKSIIHDSFKDFFNKREIGRQFEQSNLEYFLWAGITLLVLKMLGNIRDESDKSKKLFD